MATLLKRAKALSVSPLKTSQTMGAALAFLGLQKSMPLMHGSQGCTAFAKVFFVRHFREPIPLQTTAMDQVSSVMGADDNVVEALKNICEKNRPAVVGLVTTGLAETQGCDIQRAIGDFRRRYPQFQSVAVVGVNTPDFSGSFESGYALAVRGMVETLVPEGQDRVGLRKRQVNVLCGANLTPTDLEYVTDTIESFGLRPLMLPDLASSLDGHLDDGDFNPLTAGGLPIGELQLAGESAHTLVLGESMNAAADALARRTGVPDSRFGYLMGLDMVDRWLMTLSDVSGAPVPARWQKHRRQLQDAMLDTHFMLGDTRYAVAADGDLLLAFERLLIGMGGRITAAVVPARSAALEGSTLAQIQIGDLEDLEIMARRDGADLVIGNSHAAATAQRLGLPVLHAGFPLYDRIGGFNRLWCGYRGTQQALFDLANLLVESRPGIAAYRSLYAQKSPDEVALEH